MRGRSPLVRRAFDAALNSIEPESGRYVFDEWAADREPMFREVFYPLPLLSDFKPGAVNDLAPLRFGHFLIVIGDDARQWLALSPAKSLRPNERIPGRMGAAHRRKKTPNASRATRRSTYRDRLAALHAVW
jgi:hypothetical protein